MKRLFIILFLLIGIAGYNCNAQDADASWLQNELWGDSQGRPTIGPVYSMTSNSVIFGATDINDCYDANKLKVDENEN